MQEISIADELAELEAKLRKTLTLLPEVSMWRSAAERRGPLSQDDLRELDEYDRSLEDELRHLLGRLRSCMRALNWKGAPLPPPQNSKRWTRWWKSLGRGAPKRTAALRTYQ
jgi:hypothetical protein